MVKRVLRGTWRLRATAALFLGGSQGLLGWYMVKSGLVDQPHVSHFRLAAHLGLAFLCGQWVWSMVIDLNLERVRQRLGCLIAFKMACQVRSRSLPLCLDCADRLWSVYGGSRRAVICHVSYDEWLMDRANMV